MNLIKLLLLTFVPVYSQTICGQNEVWLHCGNVENGHCFDLTQTCFDEKEYICRKKWFILKHNNYEGLIGTCPKTKKKCQVKKCDVKVTLFPTFKPTNSPTISPVYNTTPTVSPTSPLSAVKPTYSTTKLPTETPSELPSKFPSLFPLDYNLTTNEDEPKYEYFSFFSFILIPLVIGCLKNPNLLTRWWRICSCWKRRHPEEVDRTEAPPENED